ncbi:uncharacterized protein LOC133531719 isoform X2 [Cydia pomonella]|uniref:uncharacterized protein LOC133531719 isoform X2 n=1 Tax=Cydia pomonella TaxID=82600 RepID=UPI002ADE5EF9|nr:uncharacterized protein LOC133531719 isoform X2 [Cydia pomonella]
METGGRSLSPKVKEEPEWHSAEDEVPPSVILLPEHMRVKVEVEFDEPSPGSSNDVLQRLPPLVGSVHEHTTTSAAEQIGTTKPPTTETHTNTLNV